jgi:outer membrane lipoprotein SlyB
MKTLLTLSVATAALAFSAPAHAQFLGGGFDNSTVLGGLAGAGLGGALGSNIAGSGNRDEGTAIGALVGGLAGAAYGNSRSNYSGNPYAGQFNPGFSGQSFLGTAVGAGLGGALGSNLAGSGQRQEGTAIGALIGGVAGYALSDNRGAFSGRGYNQPAYSQPAYGYGGGYAPVARPVQPAPVYNYNYGAPALINVQRAPLPVAAPVFGGYVNGGTYANTRTVYVPRAPRVEPITYAAPNLRLSGPLPTVPSTTHHYYSNQTVSGLNRGERVVGYSSGCYSSCR